MGVNNDPCMVSHTACSIFDHLETMRRESFTLIRRPWFKEHSRDKNKSYIQLKHLTRKHSQTVFYTGHFEDSCSSASAPLPGILPKVWLLSSPHLGNSATGGRIAAEAFVGPRFKVGPSPEYWLAPFGWWVFPRQHPRCLGRRSWVEVIRIVQPTEAEFNATFYFHAPGSGVWLDLGRTVCCNNQGLKDADNFTQFYGKDYQIVGLHTRKMNGFTLPSINPLCSVHHVNGKHGPITSWKRLPVLAGPTVPNVAQRSE